MEILKNYSDTLFDMYDYLDFDPAVVDKFKSVETLTDLVDLFRDAEQDVVPGMKFISYKNDDYACVLSIGDIDNVREEDIEKYKDTYNFYYFITEQGHPYIYYSLVE